MSFVVQFVNAFFMVLTLAIFARVLLSWFPMQPGNPLVRLIFDITEPILGPLRRILPSFGNMDFSPIVALLLLQIVVQPLVMNALRAF